MNTSLKLRNSLTFVDIFAGCGGLSLGLFQAGWNGIFAIEQEKNAFETLYYNLLSAESRYKFTWPVWLPQKPLAVSDVIKSYGVELKKLAGKVDLLVGGPPCQGFSTAGRRVANDPRNSLVNEYLEFVNILKPRIVLIENVRGITKDFFDPKISEPRINYANVLITALEQNYKVCSKVLDVSQFGVPQRRQRFFIIGISKEYTSTDTKNIFDLIEADRPGFLKSKGIRYLPIGSKAAISDLELQRNGIKPSIEFDGFNEITYRGPQTSFQKILNCGSGYDVQDTRLARHNNLVTERFKTIIEHCHSEGRLNVSLSSEMRINLGIKKKAIRVLDPEKPAPTITSMPDDLLHYLEPRTLTVRETARLQSFPDWFCFKGKYTTGGNRRRTEIPRFTQVANAVPPFIAEAIGISLAKIISIQCPVEEHYLYNH